MTPLAQALLNDWCSPIKDRKMEGDTGVLPQMLSAKCFEVTEILGFLDDLKGVETDGIFASGRVFLPAPQTFIEWQTQGPRVTRRGFLLIEKGDHEISIFLVEKSNTQANRGSAALTIYEFGSIGDSISGKLDFKYLPNIPNDLAQAYSGMVACLLFLINMPNLCGVKTHVPHIGLQRKLAAKMGVKGKFPLLAWTEITLSVSLNEPDMSVENSTFEARLSGQRCLHFVRAFLRWRLERWEVVKAHWRGAAALGIKQSRYIVKAAQ